MCSKPVLLDSTQSPVQHISSTQKGNFFSAPKFVSSTHKKRQSNKPVSLTQKTISSTKQSVQHIKSVSSTHSSAQHKNCQFNTKKVSSTQKKLQKIAFVLNWRLFSVELTIFSVELTHLTYWTDGFSGPKSSGPCVELMCWTEGVHLFWTKKSGWVYSCWTRSDLSNKKDPQNKNLKFQIPTGHKKYFFCWSNIDYRRLLHLQNGASIGISGFRPENFRL